MSILSLVVALSVPNLLVIINTVLNSAIINGIESTAAKYIDIVLLNELITATVPNATILTVNSNCCFLLFIIIIDVMSPASYFAIPFIIPSALSSFYCFDSC